ncbi:regulation of otic vesicle morphogenesis, partial [Tyrophagus putrescentiae]
MWRRKADDKVGYTSSSLEVTTISQAQFTPLAEALHRVVDELNHSLNVEATFEAVVRQLKREFPGMELPSDELLRGSLSGLVAEHKLAFDASRGLYSATRPLLTPHWDELEQLTLMTSSEGNHHHHFKGGPEEEIEIELKSGGIGGEAAAENLVNRCATSTTMEATSEYFHHLKSTGNSSKSATLSSAGNSSDGTPLEQYIRLENGDQKDDGGNKLYRRSSISLSNNDIGQQQADSNSNFELSKKGATNFKRSKSLRITSKRSTLENGGQQQQQLPKDCTCSSEIIIKRQSLFSKILKFGQNSSNGSGNHLKSRSSSACSVKSTHFGSQFPEVTTTTETLNDTEQQQETMTTKTVELTSVATQTVKCGSEDMVTLILKQAGRHALARSRSCGGGGQRSVERYANENRCLCSAKHHHNNYRESSRNGRRSNGSNRGYHTKYYLIGENENSTTQTTELTEMSLNATEHLSFADSIVSNGSYHGRHNHHQQQNHNHNHQRSHHRKLRSASLRASQQHQHHQQHYRPNEWLIDYNSGNGNNGNNNHNHSHQNNTTRKGVERTRAQRQGKQRQSLAAVPTPPNHQFRPLPVPPSLPTSPPPPFSASLNYTNGSSGYNSDLNYSNSITALKEQIARAKANFFSVPPLPSNGTLANSAAAATTTSTR